MNDGIKMFYDTVLQKNASSGEGKSCHHHSDELNATESQQYDSPAGREYAMQETLKQWYETGNGYTVRKRKCVVCGKEFYTLNNFRKYCHLSGCQSIAKQKRNEQKKREHSFEHSCSVCGSSFVSKRNDARFCSNGCRQKAYREKSCGKGTKCSLTR